MEYTFLAQADQYSSGLRHLRGQITRYEHRNTGVFQNVTTVSQTSVTVQDFKCTALRVALRTPDGTAVTFLSNNQLLIKPDLDNGVTHPCLSKAGSSRLWGEAVPRGRRSHARGAA